MAMAILHVYGLPWELSSDEVAHCLTPLLPCGCSLLEPPLLPLDKKARNSGRALLRLTTADPNEVVTALQGQRVGSRWLDVRISGESEMASQRRAVEAIVARTRERAPQAFSRPSRAHCFRMPQPSKAGVRCESLNPVRNLAWIAGQDQRDFVILCHETRTDVARGDIDLNNLPSGRVDVLARCASAAFFVSHGVREHVRLWLMLCEAGLTLCLDGAIAKGLHPDERTLGSAIRRALRSHADPSNCIMPCGWSVHSNDTLHARLSQLLEVQPASDAAAGVQPSDGCMNSTSGAPNRNDGAEAVLTAGFVVLHELGASMTPQLLSDARGAARTTVLVLGDHQGFNTEEENCFQQLGGVRVSVSPVPLLASHCIVLAHAVLDAAHTLQVDFS